MDYQPGDRVSVVYDMPLGEIIHDFYDQLKSRSRGYASLDYEITRLPEGDARQARHARRRPAGRRAVSMIVHRESRERPRARARRAAARADSRQLFEVPIQAAIGGKIVARETVSAMRKDVLAKCYGGDISRKRKLLEKQTRGQAAA